MTYDERERMLERLSKYQDMATGLPSTDEQHMYSRRMDDAQLRKVYRKWKQWAVVEKLHVA
jgi:hypothetical protein